MGWLGLVGTRGLELTDTVDQLEHQAPAPVHAIKEEKECKLWCLPAPLNWIDFQQLACHMGGF